jgi:hypothetical protein
MNNFWFKVNTSEIAKKLNSTSDLLHNRIRSEVEKISIATHAFIIQKAKSELGDGFKTNFFLGLPPYGKEGDKSSNQNGVDSAPRHVRWVKVSDNIWVVEIDEKARWIEEGREPTSMATEQWLLKPGKAKRAKDGSLYRAIPIQQMEGNKPKINTGMLGEGPGGDLVRAIKTAARKQNVSLSKLEFNDAGQIKTGVLHKLNLKVPNSVKNDPSMKSQPRSQEDAQATGLKPHGGIAKYEGMVVGQFKNDKGKISKQTVVFRTVSSKHQGENRWMYPKVEALHAMPAAKEFAEKLWGDVLKALEVEFARDA